MSDTKSTPGPWVSRERFVGTPNHMSYIAECRSSSGCWENDYMSEANARLIAAAPDLKAAVVSLLSLALGQGIDGAAVETGLAALYKATGDEAFNYQTNEADGPDFDEPRHGEAEIKQAVGEVGQDESPRGGVAPVEQTGTDS